MTVANTKTAISRARREQVVDAVIAVIAQEGYRSATYNRIAARAGLSSTRLISYHFANKDELVGAVVVTIATHIEHDLTEALARVDADDPRAQLLAYIRAVGRLHVERRAEMVVLASIVLDHRAEGEHRVWEDADDHAALGRVQDILQAGLESGHFRRFDPLVMASAVQRSLDGLGFLLERHPELDPEHYAEELVTTFELATRSTTPSSGHSEPSTVAGSRST